MDKTVTDDRKKALLLNLTEAPSAVLRLCAYKPYMFAYALTH